MVAKDNANIGVESGMVKRMLSYMWTLIKIATSVGKKQIGSLAIAVALTIIVACLLKGISESTKYDMIKGTECEKKVYLNHDGGVHFVGTGCTLYSTDKTAYESQCKSATKDDGSLTWTFEGCKISSNMSWTFIVRRGSK